MADASDDTKDAKGTTGLSKVPDKTPDEELTNGQFIDRHFARHDMNVRAMAERLDLRENEVVEIVKELGYKLPDGA